MSETIKRTVHGKEREITVQEDGTHSGTVVVSFDEKDETWQVLCPAGHYHTTVDDPNGFYGIEFWKGKTIECQGQL